MPFKGSLLQGLPKPFEGLPKAFENTLQRPTFSAQTEIAPQTGKYSEQCKKSGIPGQVTDE